MDIILVSNENACIQTFIYFPRNLHLAQLYNFIFYFHSVFLLCVSLFFIVCFITLFVFFMILFILQSFISYSREIALRGMKARGRERNAVSA